MILKSATIQWLKAKYNIPDLTEHSIYMHAPLQEELLFIQRYDEVKHELQNIVDMPDRDINMMIMFLHQNKGIFPKRRRDKFPKLTDEEIEKMQIEYRKIFELE